LELIMGRSATLQSLEPTVVKTMEALVVENGSAHQATAFEVAARLREPLAVVLAALNQLKVQGKVEEIAPEGGVEIGRPSSLWKLAESPPLEPPEILARVTAAAGIAKDRADWLRNIVAAHSDGEIHWKHADALGIVDPENSRGLLGAARAVASAFDKARQGKLSAEFAADVPTVRDRSIVLNFQGDTSAIFRLCNSVRTEVFRSSAAPIFPPETEALAKDKALDYQRIVHLQKLISKAAQASEPHSGIWRAIREYSRSLRDPATSAAAGYQLCLELSGDDRTLPNLLRTPASRGNLSAAHARKVELYDALITSSPRELDFLCSARSMIGEALTEKLDFPRIEALVTVLSEAAVTGELSSSLLVVEAGEMPPAAPTMQAAVKKASSTIAKYSGTGKGRKLDFRIVVSGGYERLARVQNIAVAPHADPQELRTALRSVHEHNLAFLGKFNGDPTYLLGQSSYSSLGDSQESWAGWAVYSSFPAREALPREFQATDGALAHRGGFQEGPVVTGCTYTIHVVRVHPASDILDPRQISISRANQGRDGALEWLKAICRHNIVSLSLQDSTVTDAMFRAAEKSLDAIIERQNKGTLEGGVRDREEISARQAENLALLADALKTKSISSVYAPALVGCCHETDWASVARAAQMLTELESRALAAAEAFGITEALPTFKVRQGFVEFNLGPAKPAVEKLLALPQPAESERISVLRNAALAPVDKEGAASALVTLLVNLKAIDERREFSSVIELARRVRISRSFAAGEISGVKSGPGEVGRMFENELREFQRRSLEPYSAIKPADAAIVAEAARKVGVENFLNITDSLCLFKGGSSEQARGAAALTRNWLKTFGLLDCAIMFSVDRGEQYLGEGVSHDSKYLVVAPDHDPQKIERPAFTMTDGKVKRKGGKVSIEGGTFIAEFAQRNEYHSESVNIAFRAPPTLDILVRMKPVIEEFARQARVGREVKYRRS
jgi:hypothetical protein